MPECCSAISYAKNVEASWVFLSCYMHYRAFWSCCGGTLVENVRQERSDHMKFLDSQVYTSNTAKHYYTVYFTSMHSTHSHREKKRYNYTQETTLITVHYWHLATFVKRCFKMQMFISVCYTLTYRTQMPLTNTVWTIFYSYIFCYQCTSYNTIAITITISM